MAVNKDKVIEISMIIDNLNFLTNKRTGFSNVIRNWKTDNISQCKQGTIPKKNHLIQQLCNKDIYQINTFVIKPLVEWLLVYRNLLEGKHNFTEDTLHTFSENGLRYLSRYAVVSEYFIETSYYTSLDYSSSSNFNATSRSNHAFSDLLITIAIKLLNCTDAANNLAQRLYSSLKHKTRITKINRDRITSACYNIRLANLKINRR